MSRSLQAVPTSPRLADGINSDEAVVLIRSIKAMAEPARRALFTACAAKAVHTNTTGCWCRRSVRAAA